METFKKNPSIWPTKNSIQWFQLVFLSIQQNRLICKINVKADRKEECNQHALQTLIHIIWSQSQNRTEISTKKLKKNIEEE